MSCQRAQFIAHECVLTIRNVKGGLGRLCYVCHHLPRAIPGVNHNELTHFYTFDLKKKCSCVSSQRCMRLLVVVLPVFASHMYKANMHCSGCGIISLGKAKQSSNRYIILGIKWPNFKILPLNKLWEFLSEHACSST